ncbi:MAG: hypothetical protein H0U49_05765 [Parachlamydiaceae bacterium]|nr:hypothetical protein [Parachlamydiaceae bacterium]
MVIDEDVYLEHFNYTTIDQEVDVFLEHFGVKGMQWGVRKNSNSLVKSLSNRQTRIKDTKAATLVARAAKSKVLVSELNSEIKALPLGLRSGYKRSTLKNKRDVTEKQISRDTKQAEKTRNSRLTPTQKKVLIGAAVVGGVLAVGYLSTRVDQETIGSAIRRARSQAEHGSIFKINKDLAAPNLSASQILSNVSKSVNPNYGSPGGTMNCRRATFTHELRRRGYDVQATTSAVGRAQNETGLINALVKGDKNPIQVSSLSAMLNEEGSSRARPMASDTRTYKAFTERVDSINNLRDSLSKQPNRARGEVVFEEYGFAHSMAYEVVNGIPHIFDSQKGTSYATTTEGLGKLAAKWGNPSAMEITRLDNVDLDLVWLSRWAENAGK